MAVTKRKIDEVERRLPMIREMQNDAKLAAATIARIEMRGSLLEEEDIAGEAGHLLRNIQFLKRALQEALDRGNQEAWRLANPVDEDAPLLCPPIRWRPR